MRRQQHRQQDIDRHSSHHHALLLAMEITPKQSVLQFAMKEVDELRRLCPDLELTPVIPQPCKEEVLANIKSAKIFHFASHARVDPTEPS